jgi:hypothetical protein
MRFSLLCAPDYIYCYTVLLIFFFREVLLLSEQGLLLVHTRVCLSGRSYPNIGDRVLQGSRVCQQPVESFHGGNDHRTPAFRGSVTHIKPGIKPDLTTGQKYTHEHPTNVPMVIITAVSSSRRLELLTAQANFVVYVIFSFSVSYS